MKAWGPIPDCHPCAIARSWLKQKWLLSPTHWAGCRAMPCGDGYPKAMARVGTKLLNTSYQLHVNSHAVHFLGEQKS